MIENTVDETTMRKIAQIGGGEFFRATDNQALSQVFDRIDKFEKAEIKETRFKDTSDYYFIYLQWAVLLFLLWLLSKSTFLSNVLQD
jgi:Ca-activated chloride channel family protein